MRFFLCASRLGLPRPFPFQRRAYFPQCLTLCSGATVRSSSMEIYRHPRARRGRITRGAGTQARTRNVAHFSTHFNFCAQHVYLRGAVGEKCCLGLTRDVVPLLVCAFAACSTRHWHGESLSDCRGMSCSQPFVQGCRDSFKSELERQLLPHIDVEDLDALPWRRMVFGPSNSDIRAASAHGSMGPRCDPGFSKCLSISLAAFLYFWSAFLTRHFRLLPPWCWLLPVPLARVVAAASERNSTLFIDWVEWCFNEMIK